MTRCGLEIVQVAAGRLLHALMCFQDGCQPIFKIWIDAQEKLVSPIDRLVEPPERNSSDEATVVSHVVSHLGFGQQYRKRGANIGY